VHRTQTVSGIGNVAYSNNILRSAQPGGPYELVGEAVGAAFNDLPVARGQTYTCVVQAYDAHGVVSPYSREVSAALPRLSTFLPAVLRAR